MSFVSIKFKMKVRADLKFHIIFLFKDLQMIVPLQDVHFLHGSVVNFLYTKLVPSCELSS